MKKTKIWLMIAALLILIGCVIFGGVMTVLNWDFNKLSTVKYETNNYEINEEYKSISIATDTADIVFVPCESANTSVVCHEQRNLKHSVTIKEDILVIEVIDTRKWYEYIGIALGNQKITVYLPKAQYDMLSIKESTGDIEIPKEFNFNSIDILTSTGDVKVYASAYGDIKIKTSTGNISAKNISADALDLSVSTGKINISDVISEGDIKINVSTGKAYMTNIKCKSVISSGNTGNISLKNVIATELFSIKRSTGNITFDKCDAAEISAQTDTGNVKGSLLSDKVFIVKSDTGKINVPKTITGGRCEITTDTGDIKIEIK